MKVIVTNDYEELSEKAFGIMADVVKANPSAVLGLATGTTPLGLYRRMIEDCRDKGTCYKGVKTVNLDEYAGLAAEHEQSYAYFMRKNLFDHIDIDLKNTHIPSGTAPDLQAECERYTALLAQMPRDLQILGLGSNGHIGFNEPGTPFSGRTHVVRLAESTVRDNSRLFDRIEDVPKMALTMGIADIMDAKKILIMASGKNKAQAVYNTVKGEVSESCPASVLQKHNNAVLIADAEAASLL